VRKNPRPLKGGKRREEKRREEKKYLCQLGVIIN